jgi:hypothetical protein
MVNPGKHENEIVYSSGSIDRDRIGIANNLRGTAHEPERRCRKNQRCAGSGIAGKSG